MQKTENFSAVQNNTNPLILVSLKKLLHGKEEYIFIVKGSCVERLHPNAMGSIEAGTGWSFRLPFALYVVKISFVVVNYAC